MTSRPRPATAASTWKSSVDLPMPGGPNNRVTEPATTPPPMTRSSSLTPVGVGAADVADTSASETASSPRTTAPRPLPVGPPWRRAHTLVATAASVFHSPQAGQRPTHRNEVVPHASHS